MDFVSQTLYCFTVRYGKYCNAVVLHIVNIKLIEDSDVKPFCTSFFFLHEYFAFISRNTKWNFHMLYSTTILAATASVLIRKFLKKFQGVLVHCVEENLFNDILIFFLDLSYCPV